MNTGALIFMLSAWVVVLFILVWSFTKLLREPPPGEDPQSPDANP